jgi:hypothetical protein
MCHKVNEEMKIIMEWLYCNKLSLNVSKTHYVVFHSRGKKICDTNIHLAGKNIEKVDKTKFLGVIIDSELSWSHHIDYICNKTSKCAGILYKARQKFQKPVMIQLYYAFVYPYLIYCNHVWGNAYHVHINRLIILQKRIIRTITCSGFREHTAQLFANNSLLKINEINVYVLCDFIFKYYDGALPIVFNDFFTLNENVHQYATRQSTNISIPFCKLNCRKNSPKIRGANLWNNLPSIVKKSETNFVFKKLLREHIFNSN